MIGRGKAWAADIRTGTEYAAIKLMRRMTPTNLSRSAQYRAAFFSSPAFSVLFEM
jgi:hypothetical protein